MKSERYNLLRVSLRDRPYLASNAACRSEANWDVGVHDVLEQPRLRVASPRSEKHIAVTHVPHRKPSVTPSLRAINPGSLTEKAKVACALAALFSIPLGAQMTSGSILGTVTDSTGAPLAAVSVSATATSTRQVSTAVTDSEGRFLLGGLAPGLYQVGVAKVGFKSLSDSDIHLHGDQKIRLELTLFVGELREVITVRGAPSMLRTETAETGQVIQSEEIGDLPLLGRNFLNLVLLVPGIDAGAGGNIANYSVNGQREFANSIVLNGVEVTGNRNNDTNVRPSIEDVEEFTTLTSSYAPEFGRASGGVIAIQTGSGTNEFHGSAYELIMTNATTARTFFAAITRSSSPAT
jgi:hypothetical protein